MVKTIKQNRFLDKLYHSTRIDVLPSNDKLWIYIDDVMIGFCYHGSLNITLWFGNCSIAIRIIQPSMVSNIMEFIISKLFNSDKFTINYIY